MSTTTIVVTPHGEGFHVSINGEDSATFTGGGQAAAEWARMLLNVTRLQNVIDEHARWLHTRTPEQSERLSAAFLREMATDLRAAAGITE